MFKIEILREKKLNCGTRPKVFRNLDYHSRVQNAQGHYAHGLVHLITFQYICYLILNFKLEMYTSACIRPFLHSIRVDRKSFVSFNSFNGECYGERGWGQGLLKYYQVLVILKFKCFALWG